jgi:hypothetical protein
MSEWRAKRLWDINYRMERACGWMCKKPKPSGGYGMGMPAAEVNL